MPTIKPITTQPSLLPAGRNPYNQPQSPPSRMVYGTAARKVSAPTIIDADTVILDPQAADWLMLEPDKSSPPPRPIQSKHGQRDRDDPTPFYWRLALNAYAHQLPAYTPLLATGVQINLVA
jgi:hypothetical protein